MPSDPRLVGAFTALNGPIEQYRSAVAATLEEVRGHLSAGRSDAQARAARLQRQLGAFASGRIDAARLAALTSDRNLLDVTALARLERASETLSELLDRGRDLFHVTVPAGWDLHGFVATQLAAIGRAFAAARIASSARSGAPAGLVEPAALAAFPFAEWNAAERKLAPPLIVTLRGSDLVAGALAPFLDGAQKILLLVDGPCPPASLVRLITPNVFVLQAHALDELAAFASWPTTGVAALVPAAAARFVHDPAAGASSWQRLTLHVAAEQQVARVGGMSAAQQLDEVRQLEALATRPPSLSPPEPIGPATAPSDPTDRLAAWLLQQAQLTSTSR
jgi:hypothetical protein